MGMPSTVIEYVGCSSSLMICLLSSMRSSCPYLVASAADANQTPSIRWPFALYFPKRRFLNVPSALCVGLDMREVLREDAHLQDLGPEHEMVSRRVPHAAFPFRYECIAAPDHVVHDLLRQAKRLALGDERLDQRFIECGVGQS